MLLVLIGMATSIVKNIPIHHGCILMESYLLTTNTKRINFQLALKH